MYRLFSVYPAMDVASIFGISGISGIFGMGSPIRSSIFQPCNQRLLTCRPRRARSRILRMSDRVLVISTIMLLMLGAGSVAAQGEIAGLYQTEAGDGGGYLHVRIGQCEDNIETVCGVIEKAFSDDDEESTDYEHLGKKMLWAMKSKDGKKYSGGKIWAPDRDKTYRSKVWQLDDGVKVKGCVGPICRSMIWTRVE